MRGPFAAQPAAGLADAIGRLLSVEPRPDCVVITGDLAGTGHPDEYATLRDILRRCPVPVHLLPGNHDDPAALIARFGDTPYLGNGVSPSYTVEYPRATLVIANSWVQGSPAGCLGPAQLAWIDQALGARRDVPAFVCLHHPPVPVGIPFLDGMILDDAAGLAEVIEKHPHVVRVLAGHVHRDTSALFAGTMMTTAPSTWRQAALRLHDAEPPGLCHRPDQLPAARARRDQVRHALRGGQPRRRRPRVLTPGCPAVSRPAASVRTTPTSLRQLSSLSSGVRKCPTPRDRRTRSGRALARTTARARRGSP